MIRLTQTGWVFLGLTGMLYMGALQSETGLLYFVVGILGSCFLLNGWSARRSVQGLSIELPHEVAAFEGQRLSEAWVVRNDSPRTLGLASVAGPWGPLLRVGMLEPGEHVSRTPECVLPRRGVYPFSSLNVTSSWPFGLLEWKRALPLHGEIVVYPTVYPTEAPTAAGYEPMVGGHYSGGHKSRSGTHFSGVRDLQPGDPLRSIHWKSSARGQGLLVKEFDEELSGRVSIVIDPGAEPASRGETTLDWATRAAASLLFAALDRGHHVELVDLHGQHPILVPPFSDGTPALDALARLQPDPKAFSRESLARAVGSVSHKSSLLFVLPSLRPELVDFLHEPDLARRKALLLLPATRKGAEPLAGGLAVQYYAWNSVLPAGYR